ncbi:peptide chain release factor 1 [Roseomonas sp. OT10]|uniref:peptide chain release factor 1 n=1 Tax=Roseomonas cutis TaxID=2897332 RepID=UPI001E428D1C|nr:peptide chain release factor 1 [Roseomonas sp. OT10]UFN49872.1 peptide chain release factor 1 [Roseomonas sp. OT10]
MTETELEQRLLELERLLNDPETRMDPDRVWTLLDEVSPCVPPEIPALPATVALPPSA